MINTVTLVQAKGHDDGAHVVSAALFFVPRSLWTGKATPASIEVARERGYWFTDLSLTPPGRAVPGSRLAGADRDDWRPRFRVAPVGPHVAWQGAGALIASYLAVAQIGLIRGPLGSLVPVYGIVVLILVALLIRSNRLAEP